MLLTRAQLCERKTLFQGWTFSEVEISVEVFSSCLHSILSLYSFGFLKSSQYNLNVYEDLSVFSLFTLECK